MMAIVPRCAVVLATYNGAKYLQEQLASIDSQVGVSVTIFISDDCSTDGSLQIVEEFSSSSKSSIKLISSGSKFGSATANFFSAIQKVPLFEFDFVCFSDQDDIWLPEKLSRAVEFIMVNDVEGYSSNVIAWYSSAGKGSLVEKSGPQTAVDYMFQGSGPGCTMVLRSRASALLGDFLSFLPAEEVNSIWQHDWFIYSFFRAKNLKWGIDRYAGVLYRQHNANVIGANQGLGAMLKRFHLLKEWKRQIKHSAKILGYESDIPIASFSPLGISLVTSPFSVRRKVVESLFVFFLFLVSAY